MDISSLSEWLGNSCYGALALVALWGLYCVLVVWRRVSQLRFRSAADQQGFLQQLDGYLAAQDFSSAAQWTAQDARALPQLCHAALGQRDQGVAKLRNMVVESFQRDVIADLDYRSSWVYTVIKTAPMLGLFGTVLGMMAAFGKLGTNIGGHDISTGLAGDIQVALYTTAIGLAIAIPLTLVMAAVNIRVRRMEDLVAAGLTHFLDRLKAALGADAVPPRRL